MIFTHESYCFSKKKNKKKNTYLIMFLTKPYAVVFATYTLFSREQQTNQTLFKMKHFIYICVYKLEKFFRLCVHYSNILLKIKYKYLNKPGRWLCDIYARKKKKKVYTHGRVIFHFDFISISTRGAIRAQ